MNIDLRNQDIVRRSVTGVSFASLGDEYGISRERVRQIFDIHATAADKKAVKKLRKPKPKPVSTVYRGPKDRLHVMLARPTDLRPNAIRAGIRDWIDGRLKINIAATDGIKHRFSVTMPEPLGVAFRAKCDKVQLSPSAAIRAIITALENAK